MYLKIVRLEHTDAGTRGVLLVNGDMFATTMERPWEDNEKSISCVPKGTYKAKKYTSKHHGKTLCLADVVNRSGILFHVGNTMGDSEGCILLGEGFAKSSYSITSSAAAMARFKELIATATTFTVQIV